MKNSEIRCPSPWQFKGIHNDISIEQATFIMETLRSLRRPPAKAPKLEL
jgi:hypothetical protein